MVKSDLELQLDSSIPENLKSNEAINTLLSIYTSSFDELQLLLENPLNVLDTDFLINRVEETSNQNFDEIRKELFKIHLEEIYRTFDNIEESEEIYNKFKTIYEALDISTEKLRVVADIDKSISSEYINASTSYKTKKGTRAGFFFVYDIINKAGIQSINSDTLFNLIEGTEENPNTPYEYTVETSLYKEVFDRTITPLAHPVGFNWNFIRLLFLSLTDHFGLKETKTLDSTTLTCYGIDEGAITQKEIINSQIFGKLDEFTTSEDQNSNEKIVIDYYPKDNTIDKGLRLVRDYNGEVILYDRQSTKTLYNDDNNPLVGQIVYLDFEEIRLINDVNGLITINEVERTLLYENYVGIESVDFTEYTIIDNQIITFEFKIRGDKANTWYTSILLLEDKIVNEEDTKYFLPKTFSRQDILDGCNNYNGIIVEDYGINCQIHYKTLYTYKVITKDISEYIEGVRPGSINLPSSTDEIIIEPTELMRDIGQRLDPYKGLYSTLDHTVEEFNWYENLDFWARLDPGSKRPQPIIGQTNLNPILNSGHLAPEIKIDEDTQEITYIPDGEIIDLCIGGDWVITEDALHIFDIGFNPNSNPERWEQYYKPLVSEDLKLLKSTTSGARYIRDNTEFENTPFSNNDHYTAWEDFTMDVNIEMFKNQIYCYDDLGDSWNIGDKEFIGCLYIGGGTASSGYVDAELYRDQWNFREGSPSYGKYDSLAFNSVNYLKDYHDISKEITEKYYNKLYIDEEDFYSHIEQNTNIGEFNINGNNVNDTNLMYIGHEIKFSDSCSIEETILMSPKVTYQYNTFKSLYINGFDIGSYNYIDGIGYGEEVEAEIYRAEWNYHEEHSDYNKYDKISYNYSAILSDIIIKETLDEDNIAKSMTDSESSISSKHIRDSYSQEDGNLIISNEEGLYFNIGDITPIDVRIGNLYDITEDNWEFGVYRYDDILLEWVLLEDNNIAQAA